MDTVEVLVVPSRSAGWHGDRLSVAGLPLNTVLLSRLQQIDPAQVGDDECIERIVGCQRMINMLQAQLMLEQAEFARRRFEGPFSATRSLVCQVNESAHQEVGSALHLTSRTAQNRFITAVALVDELPCVVDALMAGWIDYSRAEIFHKGTAHLDPRQAIAVAFEALKTAENLTTSELRYLLQRLCAQVAPEATEKAMKKKAKHDRDVKAYDRGDGNADMMTVGASGDVAEAMAIINSAAWEAKRADKAAGGEVRSIGEARVDTLLDLIRGPFIKHYPKPKPDSDSDSDADTEAEAGVGHHCSCGTDHTTEPPNPPSGSTSPAPATGAPTSTGVNSTVNVTIALSEFLKLFNTTNTNTDGDSDGDSDVVDENGCTTTKPGEIEGLGYVPAWVARTLVGDLMDEKSTRFRAVIFDDTTGQFVAATSPSYRPATDLANHVKLRDRTCVYPGCRQPARICDVDHIVAWGQDGPTAECNLQCLCRTHHRLKQRPGWNVRTPEGYATWTTPTGHVRIRRPHDYRDPAIPLRLGDDDHEPDHNEADHDEPPDERLRLC